MSGPAVTDLIHSLKGPIAVFGASGFIGANLLRLIKPHRSDYIAVIQRPSAAWRLNLLGIPKDSIALCDIEDASAVGSLMREKAPSTVFNLAAYGAYSKQNEIELIYRTNILGTLNILEACSGISAYVHAGSSSEYGLNCASPREDSPLSPNSHYAVSKASANHLVQYYGRCRAVPTVALRLYSVYGPWEEPDRLIPRLIEEARRGALPPFVNPRTTRDFVYVEDCVEAFLRAAVLMNERLHGETLNIGTGQKTPLQDLVQTAREIFTITKEPAWGTMEKRAWDTEEWYGNHDKASALIAWSPSTPLRTGLELTSAWQKSSRYEEVILPAFHSAR